MTDRLVQLQPMHAHALESFLSEFDACPEERHGYFEPREASIETVIELEVPPGQSPVRIDLYLTDKTANATRTKVQRAIKEGRVEVNGAPWTRFDAAEERVSLPAIDRSARSYRCLVNATFVRT